MRSCTQHQILIDKTKKSELVGHVICRGKSKGAYRDLVGQFEGKNQLERPRCRGGIVLK